MNNAIQRVEQIRLIGTQIKRLRKEIDLDQVEFAKRAGVGLRFLRELEQGKVSVRLDKVYQVLNFLGYHLELKRTEYKGIDHHG